MSNPPTRAGRPRRKLTLVLAVASTVTGALLSGCATPPAPPQPSGPTAFEKSLLSAVNQVKSVTQDLRVANQVPHQGAYNGFPMPQTNALPPIQRGIPGPAHEESGSSPGFSPWDQSAPDSVLETPVSVNYPSGPIDPLLSLLASQIGFSYAHDGPTQSLKVSVVVRSGTLGQVLRMIEGQLPPSARLILRPSNAMILLSAERESRYDDR